MHANNSAQQERNVTTDIPCYAVIGKVNMGKSSVLATLLEEDDDRIIRISAEPGETTRCQSLSLTLDGRECLRFIDTPGFQQPIEALRRIQALHHGKTSTPDFVALQRFVTDCKQEFPDECSLLAPLLAGAGVIYIIDPDRPLRDSFLAEIEILRWTGRPRLALLNSRSAKPAYEADWRDELGRGFNLVRSFNAHHARFASRRQLITMLGQIEERHQKSLERTLQLLDQQWQQRRDASTDALLECLEKAFAWREKGHFDTTGKPQDNKKLIDTLSRQYFKQIARLEYRCSKQILAIYRHKHLDATIRNDLQAALGDNIDWSSQQTWQRLGLSRKQLTITGAAVGAGAGVSLDAATLGQTLGLAALLGGIGGGSLSWYKSHALPTLSLTPKPLGRSNQSTQLLGPPNNPNFGWILLDSLLLRYQFILGHAHGRRDLLNLAAASTDQPGIASQLPRERRKILARAFEQWRNNRPLKHEEQLFDAIAQTLAEVEARLDADPNA